MAKTRCSFLYGLQCAAPDSGRLHQLVSLKLAASLLQYVDASKRGRVLYAPFDVVLSSEVIVQPDILFVACGRTGLIGEKSMVGLPDLVIEVLPHTEDQSVIEIRRKIYLRFEINEYWVVDFVDKRIDVLLWSELGYLPAGIYGESDRLSSPTLPGFKLSLSRLFSKPL